MATHKTWPTVMDNLSKAHNKLVRIYLVLGREGADTRMSEIVLEVIVQVILLFGSEMWVVNPCILRTLGLSIIWFPSG